MGRFFDKSTSNRILLTRHAVSSYMDGAPAVSIHAFIRPVSFASGTPFGDTVINALTLGSTAIRLNINTEGAHPVATSIGRSIRADPYQTGNGVNEVLLGVWQSIGCCLDFANEEIAIFLNGKLESVTSVSFSSPFYVHQSGSTGDDYIGTNSLSVAERYFHGDIDGVAMWRERLDENNFSALGKGATTHRVQFESIIQHWPLWGIDSPEREFVENHVGTIVGSVPQSTTRAPMRPFTWVVVPPPPPGPAGPVVITPTPATARADTVGPTVVRGPVTVTPTIAVARADTAGPTVVRGPVTVTPTIAVARADTVGPTVVRGPVTVTPTIAVARADTVGPVVSKGGTTITPAPAFARADTVGPTVVRGPVTITPAPVFARADTIGPDVIIPTGVIVTPAPVEARADTVDPVIIRGAITVTPTIAVAVAETAGPTIGIPEKYHVEIGDRPVLRVQLGDRPALKVSLSDRSN